MKKVLIVLAISTLGVLLGVLTAMTLSGPARVGVILALVLSLVALRIVFMREGLRSAVRR